MFEENVKAIVLDTLLEHFGLTVRPRLTLEPTCDLCGKYLQQNLDLYGNHNGFVTHPLIECIGHLKQEVAELRAQIAELKARS